MTGLTDRVAVVTGASGGIGAGLAAMLAAEGVRVVLAARRQDALERVAVAIRETGGIAQAIVTDLTQDTSLANLVERTRAEFGPIDILVNTAGTRFGSRSKRRALRNGTTLSRSTFGPPPICAPQRCLICSSADLEESSTLAAKPA